MDAGGQFRESGRSIFRIVVRDVVVPVDPQRHFALEGGRLALGRQGRDWYSLLQLPVRICVIRREDSKELISGRE